MSGGTFYPNQKTTTLFGSKSATNVLTPVALTNAYDAANTTKVVEVAGKNIVAIYLSYTTGAAETGNSIDIRVQASSDGTNYFTLVNDATAGGVSTLTSRTFTVAGIDAAGNIKVSIPLEVMYDFINISVKETGVAANAGSLFGEITTSGN